MSEIKMAARLALSRASPWLVDDDLLLMPLHIIFHPHVSFCPNPPFIRTPIILEQGLLIQYDLISADYIYKGPFPGRFIV